MEERVRISDSERERLLALIERMAEFTNEAAKLLCYGYIGCGLVDHQHRFEELLGELIALIHLTVYVDTNINNVHRFTADAFGKMAMSLSCQDLTVLASCQGQIQEEPQEEYKLVVQKNYSNLR